jgi:hypothetical protein
MLLSDSPVGFPPIISIKLDGIEVEKRLQWDSKY